MPFDFLGGRGKNVRALSRSAAADESDRSARKVADVIMITLTLAWRTRLDILIRHDEMICSLTSLRY